MPAPEGHLTPKQEKFCQKYVEIGNASEAYRHAYDVGEHTKPATVNRKAKVEMDKGKIRARVEELQAGHQKRHEVTVDSLTVEYDEVREAALKDGQYSPAVSSITGKAKLHGLLTEKHDHNVNITLETIKREIYGDG